MSVTPAARGVSQGPGAISRTGLLRASRDVIFVVLLAATVAWVFSSVSGAHGDGAIGFDFEGTLWDAAIDIREGRSPYPQPTEAQVDVGNPALYPPLLMFVVAPLTLLPWSVALSLWTIALGLCIAGTLYALDVRDVRCYLLAIMSEVVVTGLIWGNATLLLVPLVALAWRWRDRVIRVGVVVGLAIAAKLFLWPLLFWLLGTRRYRAFGAAVTTVVLAVLAPWAVIGFKGLTTYPELLRLAQDLFAVHGYSVTTMLSALGAETHLAIWITISVGLVLASAAFVVGRSGRDEAAVSLAILAALFGSPILWEYYYALLLIPLAMARPRFSWLWLVLPLFFLTHRLPRPRLLSTDLEPEGSACCWPGDVPLSSWVFNHGPPGLWPAMGHAMLAVGVAAACFVTMRSSRTGSQPPRI
jgi:hypothetical protein